MNMSAMQDTVIRPAGPVVKSLQPAMPPNSERIMSSPSDTRTDAAQPSAPVRRQTPRKAATYNIPPLLRRPASTPQAVAAGRQVAGMDAVAASDTTETAVPDSLAVDSLAAGNRMKAIVLVDDRPMTVSPTERPDSFQWQNSLTVAILLVLFSLCAIRFRGNRHFPKSLLRDLTEVRERHNVFDETVRETSFLTLLNLLFCASAGTLLYRALCTFGAPAGFPGRLPAFRDAAPLMTAVCMGVCVAYTLVMTCAYTIVGNVFSDRHHAAMWARGFTASQALLSLPLLLLALLCICCPQWSPEILATAASAFIITKIAFIVKGFRIFFTQISSWILFLYYLCSLEIIPLILTYLAALALCSVLS